MKQKFRFFLCVCLSLVLLPLSVSAYSESRSPAAGYDPSTTQIDFNIPLDPDGPFYVTVFTSEPQGNLKLRTSGGKTGDASPGRDAYRKLSEYRDSDGLTFCGEVSTAPASYPSLWRIHRTFSKLSATYPGMIWFCHSERFISQCPVRWTRAYMEFTRIRRNMTAGMSWQRLPSSPIPSP